MLLHIHAVLDQNQLKVINTLLDDAVQNARFVAGKQSAGRDAQGRKHNVELSQQTEVDQHINQQINQMLMPALLRHPQYQASVLPLKVASPYYVRYEPSMHYGFHVDDPIMGVATGSMHERYRSDVSTTVFLNDEYTGGELVIKTATGEQSFTAAAGDAIIYPATFMHRVSKVRSGERRVAVTWAQSMVRSAAKRELLYELHSAKEALYTANSSEGAATNSATYDKINGVYTNLLRRWGDV